ncbi:PKD domain-containing protein [Promicromonospora sp. NPDC059942]|uniref:PKD domain-containing protein n=1 Tax=Promicromonospora sp. NPDC059942 TaxID=3347009 RepID=UPI003664A661
MSGISVVLLASAMVFAVPQANEQPTFSGTSEHDQVSVEAITPIGAARAPIEAAGDRGRPSLAPPVRQWRVTPALCFLRDLGGATVLAESCDEGHRLAYEGIECEDDEQAVGALFEQRQLSGEWSDAALVEDESCLAERRRQVDIPAAAARAFQEMQIAPSEVNVQPPDGWTLVNADTIAFTDREPRTVSTELFGIPVDIRAVPSSYSWDFGDGTAPLSTTDPGAPYPAHTIAHAYAKQGTATISLTTTWSGQFRLAGEPTWRGVPGEATTASSSGSLEILEARARLVEDLYGG